MQPSSPARAEVITLDLFDDDRLVRDYATVLMGSADAVDAFVAEGDERGVLKSLEDLFAETDDLLTALWCAPEYCLELKLAARRNGTRVAMYRRLLAALLSLKSVWSEVRSIHALREEADLEQQQTPKTQRDVVDALDDEFGKADLATALHAALAHCAELESLASDGESQQRYRRLFGSFAALRDSLREVQDQVAARE